ncbi:MAG: 50S ribosomal protein L25 [Limisphaerales bacterium]
MKSIALTAFPRTQGRRAGAKKLRATERLPAVIYGRHNPPQSLEIKLQDLKDAVHSAASEIMLVDLSVTGDPKPKRLALVQEIQHHVLTHQVLHIDLHEVAENEKVTVQVPVEPLGEPLGVKTGGGTLEHVLFKLRVRALPKDLPEVLMADVSHLEIGKAVHIGELKAPPGVEILGDKNMPVLSVAAPVSEAQEAATLESAVTPSGEVEMIKEKKEEGAEGEAKPGEKGAAKGAEKAPAKGAEKAPAKAGDKSAAPVAEKAAEKKPEKKPKK